MFCGGVLRFGAVAVTNRGTHRAKAEKNFDGSTTGRYVTAEKQESVGSGEKRVIGRRRSMKSANRRRSRRGRSAAVRESSESRSIKGNSRENAAGKIGRFCVNKAVYTH